MARITSFYHASAATPLANHGDFFNTHACFQQLPALSLEAAFASILSGGTYFAK